MSEQIKLLPQSFVLQEQRRAAQNAAMPKVHHPKESLPIDWMRPGMVLLDVETTGLDPHRHSVIEFACLDWRGASIWSSHRMRPGREVDPIALAVNGASIESLDVREPGYFQAIEDLFDWLDERREAHGEALVIAGMNPHFDRAFCDVEWDHLYRGKKLRRPWTHRHHDLHTLAGEYLAIMGSRQERLHSEKIAELLGIDPEPKPHNAMQGIAWEAQCFSRIHRNLQKLKEALQ